MFLWLAVQVGMGGQEGFWGAWRGSAVTEGGRLLVPFTGAALRGSGGCTGWGRVTQVESSVLSRHSPHCPQENDLGTDFFFSSSVEILLFQ